MKTKEISLIIGVLIILSNVQQLCSQTNTIEREWTSFQQTLEVKTYKDRKFKLLADINPMGTAENSSAGLYINQFDKKGEILISESEISNESLSDQWNTYFIEGTIKANTTKIDFGGTVLGNGKFYFDDFELYIENDLHELELIELQNQSFEQTITETNFSGWDTEKDADGNPIKVLGFSFKQSKKGMDGSHVLLIEGKDIKRNLSTIINPEKGYTPQIGTLVAMLNNLSERVEKSVNGMDERELDFLIDDKANSIGALIMHLAAAETYYQVSTFENRGFNEEEKIKWQAALELDEKGRLQIKAHDVSYYLDLYKKVRERTLAVLKKRDDEWLAKTPKGGIMNNHFSWFHVMEHQSSHLGQILLLKKRIPKEELAIELMNKPLD